MEVNEKLIKQIEETKYLSAENSYRYRPIMRCFLMHYERLEYSLYKEDIYEELIGNELFSDYSIVDCERDLDTLVEWKSLSKMQDTKNAVSIEDFRNKKFRYQLTEYAIEIERLTIVLENMEIKTASLEPKLFDRLRINISKLEEVSILELEEVNDIWTNINDDFTKLNQNYQDFLKKFNDQRSEELMQSVVFLQFKRDIVKYLKDFIIGYQNNIHYIRSSIGNINNNHVNEFLQKQVDYLKRTPAVMGNFNFDYYEEVNRNKIYNVFKWFVGTEDSISEGDKLIDTTNNIIVKITKYANSLIELHGNFTNRKEEYKHLCKLFDKLPSVSDCHKYASLVFGIHNVRHFVGSSKINTDVIVNSYDIPPTEIVLSSRTKFKKEKVSLVPIEDKRKEKQRLLEEYRKEISQNKEILSNLIKDKHIKLDGKMTLSKIERRYIQKLISSSKKKETEFGLVYDVVKKDGKCEIASPDGIFFMDSVDIIFEGDLE